MFLARRFLEVPGENAELVRAQYQAFTKQIPLLYFILVINTLAISYTFHGVAPYYLSLYIPGALTAFCLLRMFHWLGRRGETPPVEVALASLRFVNRLAALLAISFTIWGLSVYPYGDPYARAQVAIFMGLTVIGCVFCLMHLRSAAIIVALFADIPFVLYFLNTGEVHMQAMAINIGLVAFTMMVVLFGYSRDFANLVDSRKSLIVKQQETQRLSDENLRLANLDSLTDLPNRRRFFAALDDAFDRANGSGRLAIGVLDLDGFKPVNDTYGHLVGDRLLVEASRRLEHFAGGVGTVYRLGGDEFALIVESDVSDDKLHSLGRRLIEAMRTPFLFDPLDIRIGCSIGFATFPESANTPAQLYERADYALYHAKRHMRGESVLFSSEHEEQIRKYGAIELAMQGADLEAELSMVFQPIIDVTTGRPLALEALARWTSPTLGEVSPGTFIPVAERNGMIRKLTRILLKKALLAVRNWPKDVKLSFNLSAHDISSPEGMLRIVDIIQRSGIDAKRIDFEITETAVTSDFEKARQTILMLKALGAGVSLDDFGAGYSSLSHVRSLPLDKIKIDRSFVADIETNKISHDIVKSLQLLCADVGIVCVVEGVENAGQVATLAGIGCNFMQGYYFSRPIAEHDVAAFFADSGRSVAAGLQVAAN